MKKTFFAFLLISALCLPGTSAFAAGQAKASVENTVQSIIETLKDETLKADSAKRREKISTLIHSRFNFPEMAKRSLARNWKNLNQQQQKEFVDVFSQLIIASYIDKVEGYTNETVNYGEEELKGGGKYAVVDTIIVTKDVEIPVGYKLIPDGSDWKVYDVTIEGVSFVSTYRTQYNKIIKKDGYDGLIGMMKNKLDEVKALEK